MLCMNKWIKVKQNRKVVITQVIENDKSNKKK